MSSAGPAPLEQAVGAPLIDRDGFDALIAAALAEGHGFAAGKLGGSERAWLQHPMILERESEARRLRAFEAVLGHRSLKHSGIFPTDPAFLREFTAMYSQSFAALDAIGLFPEALTEQAEIVRFHRPPGALMLYQDQEPDRSVPAQDDRCWLRHLRDRRVLLICPFANLLRERADRETFEAVWAKTGKRWFDPANVEAIEFPYGFAAETRERYGTALNLLDELTERVDSTDFDVALIAAGGLGIPLAAHVRGMQRVGISVGGHLQVVFGVAGERWLQRDEWRRLYINESWIRLPPEYVPDLQATGENYW